MHDAIDAHVIAERLERVREQIARACQRAGRSPETVTLIGVTKTFPLDVVAAARDAGLRDFGENRVQELVEKAQHLPGRRAGGDLVWHMIGHLQRNKARDVVACADLFHALDSPRLAGELDKRAADAERVLPCLVQVNISGEDSKYGLAPVDAAALLDQLEDYPHLHVLGLMGIASPVDEAEAVRPEFRRLRALYERYEASSNPRLRMAYLSMGMSGDFEVAVEEGATHVRLGSALFGPRP